MRKAYIAVKSKKHIGLVCSNCREPHRFDDDKWEWRGGYLGAWYHACGEPIAHKYDIVSADKERR